jgi:hypothetical protein
MDEGGRRGERATGTPNTIYDLSSVLFHSLEGGASYDQYIRDAEEAGDEELVDFFTRVRDEDSMRADEAQTLLAERTPTAAPTEGAASRRPTERLPDELPPVAEPSAGAPRTEDVAPTRAGEVPPMPGEPAPRTEEDRGLLYRAREPLTGEEEPRRREEARPRREAPRGPRGDEP